jgi:hypothetical protein
MARRLVDDQVLDRTVDDCRKCFCHKKNAIFHREFGMRLDLREGPLNESRKICAKNCG